MDTENLVRYIVGLIPSESWPHYYSSASLWEHQSTCRNKSCQYLCVTRWESWSEIIKISGHPLQFQLGNRFFPFLLNPFNKLSNSFKPWTYYRKHANKLVLSKYMTVFKITAMRQAGPPRQFWNLLEVTPWVWVEFGLRSWWILSNSFITREGLVLYVSPLALQTGAFLRLLAKLRGSHLLIREQSGDETWLLLWGADFDHLMPTSGRRGHLTREERCISSCSCSTL